MQISISINNSKAYFQPIKLTDEADLAKYATTNSITLGTFKDNHRTLSNFQSCEIIGLDIDNGETEEKMSLTEAKLAFQKYKHVILTSRSHQKPKNGKVVDRFRVFLFLEEPIKDIFTFYATWDYLKARYPAIDSSCKDASRFWFASPGLISVNYDGELVPLNHKEKSEPTWRVLTSTIDQSKKGKLSKRTHDFLNHGAEPGSWNTEVFKAAKDMQEQLYTIEEAIELLTRPTLLPGCLGRLDNNDNRTIESAYSREPRYAPRQDRNQALVNVIKECHLIIDQADNTRTSLVDLNSGERFDVCRENIKQLLNRDEYNEFKQYKMIYATYMYNPYAKTILFEQRRGLIGYNMYTPPTWLIEHYYRGTALPPGAVPPIINKFLHHLTGGDLESLEYVFDWLTTAINDRNYTMLTAIGDQGIGKGVFGYLMEKLFGVSNFKKTRDEVFKKSFNAQLEDKRLIYIDELALNTKEAHDRLKDMINDSLEIEAKGKDAKTIKNHASFYISSNHIDALHLEPDDRRISAIELTTKPLLKQFTREEIEEQILNDDNVNDFACWLYHRKVERDMRIPFRSEKFAEMMEAGLRSWQRWLLFELTPELAGKTVDIKEVQKRLKFEFPDLRTPGVTPISKLSNLYSKYFRVKQPAEGLRGQRVVEFYTVKEVK